MEKQILSKDSTIAASQYIKEKDYWLNKLTGELENTSFAPDYTSLEIRNREEAELKFKFDENVFTRLMKVSKDANPKLYMILAAALLALINKYSGSKDITFFAPIYKQRVEANFINTVLVLRNEIDGNIPFKDLLLQVRDCIQEATQYQNYPIETILYDLNQSFFYEKTLSANIAVLLDNIHDPKYIEHIHPNICFCFRKGEKELELTLQYNSLLYKRGKIERMANHYNHLLDLVLTDVNTPLINIDILSLGEREQLLIHFNNTASGYPKDKLIQELFEEQVQKHPGNIAVTYDNERLSYRQLNEKANGLAHDLRMKGIHPGTIAAIMVEYSLEMITGILGILKAGGAYLPIAVELPPQRVTAMLKDSGALVLLTRERLLNIYDYRCDIVDFDEERQFINGANNPDIINKNSDAAYIIYTSGSTGNSKGVMVEHRSILNYIYWRITKFSITPADVSLQLVSFSFDGFNANLYPAILSGGSIVLLNQLKWNDQTYIRDIIRAEKVTNFSVVPSMYRVLLDGAHEDDFMSVRFVVLAGEKADQGIVSLSKQLVPQARLINEYGPTENSVAAAACFEMSAGHVNSIGTPISNNQVFILDGDQKLIPIGIYGELCVSGDSLARGYLNRPELTQEKFIPNPYIQDVEMYKTGDLARWEEDGNISILGRIDNQVKIRGYRIEPGEIEKQLLRHPEIKEAVVIPRNDNRGEKWLCAYFTSKHELSAAEIRGYLETHLPGYMIPAFFIEIELFPLNVNGKIDLKKLPEPAGYMNSGVEYQAPRTDIEKSLVLIWQKELGLDKIGIHDNYFNIGGDSIKSIRLINTINEELNKKLNVVDLYTNNTIEQLAQKIEQEPQCDDDGNSQVSGEYGEVLSELEELQKKIMGGGNLGNE